MNTKYEQLVTRLYGAAFKLGTLELNQGVSYVSLQKADDAARKARLDLENEFKSMGEEVERLRFLTEPQPIETAPKDGTPILVRNNDGRTYLAAWMKANHVPLWDWHAIPQCEDDVDLLALKPTHWLPLPKMEAFK